MCIAAILKGSYRGWGRTLVGAPLDFDQAQPQKTSQDTRFSKIILTAAFSCRHRHLGFAWMDSCSRGPRYRSPHTRSLPVRNQRGTRGTHRVALRLLFLKPNSQVVLQDSSPCAFLRVQEGERDSTQASNASAPRRRAEDTASRCALVPAEKVSNKAFVANKRQKTPHLSAFSSLCRDELHNSCRSQPKQGNVQRRGEKGAAAWVKCQRLTLVWSVSCLSSAEDAPGLRCRKKSRCCHSIRGSYWLLSPFVSAPCAETWGELGVFVRRELPLAEQKWKRAVVGGPSPHPFKSRGSWEFGQPVSFCPRRGGRRATSYL